MLLRLGHVGGGFGRDRRQEVRGCGAALGNVMRFGRFGGRSLRRFALRGSGCLVASGFVAGRRIGEFAAQSVVVAVCGRMAVAATVPARAPVDLIVGGALGALLFVDQRLAVGDRDLIVVRVDFAERQEAVAVAAVIDESGLQRRLDARHLRQIDIAAELLTVCGLEVEFLDAIAAQYDHPGLLGMGRVDEHFVGHFVISRRAACRLVRAASATGNGGLPDYR